MSDKMSQLLDLVLARTQNRELSWQDTPDDETFDVHLSANSFSISDIGRGSHEFTVFDSSGRRLESIKSIEVNRWEDSAVQFNQKLADLYDEARRQALRVDDNIEELIKALS